MNTSRMENQRKWREHIAKASEYGGSLASYCRENGISIPRLHYWRGKLAVKPRKALEKTSPFIPIQVMNMESLPGSPNLPDAKWVADILFHLSARLSRSNR